MFILNCSYHALIVHMYFRHKKTKVKTFGEKTYCGSDFMEKKLEGEVNISLPPPLFHAGIGLNHRFKSWWLILNFTLFSRSFLISQEIGTFWFTGSILLIVYIDTHVKWCIGSIKNITYPFFKSDVVISFAWEFPFTLSGKKRGKTTPFGV